MLTASADLTYTPEMTPCMCARDIGSAADAGQVLRGGLSVKAPAAPVPGIGTAGERGFRTRNYRLIAPRRGRIAV